VQFVGGIVAVLVGLGLIGYKALELLDYDVKQYSSLLKEHVTYLLHRCALLLNADPEQRAIISFRRLLFLLKRTLVRKC
jgi:hypothetical protein